MNKRFGLLTLIVCMLVFIMNFNIVVNAAIEQNCGDNLTWSVGGGVLKITGEGKMYDYGETSPAPWTAMSAYVDTIWIGDGVTSIGKYAFKGLNEVTKIDIANSVLSIGNNAFQDCTKLTELTIPYGVKVIGDEFISGCSIEKLIIPESVVTLGWNPYYGCETLTELTVPFLGQYRGASDLGWDEISFPENVKKITVTNETIIPDSAFAGAPSVTDIIIEGNPKVIRFGALDGCDNLENLVIKSTSIVFEEIGESMLWDKKYNLYGYEGSTVEAYANIIGEEYVEFISLGDPEREYVTQCSATEVDGYIVINAEFNKAITDQYVIVALYSGDKTLIETVTVPATGEYTQKDIVLRDNVDADYIKIFLLKNVSSITPLGDAAETTIER